MTPKISTSLCVILLEKPETWLDLYMWAPLPFVFLQLTWSMTLTSFLKENVSNGTLVLLATGLLSSFTIKKKIVTLFEKFTQQQQMLVCLIDKRKK